MISNKMPKNIGLKMGSEDERNWTQIRDAARDAIKQSEFNIKLQVAVEKMAAKKIRAERRSFKQK